MFYYLFLAFALCAADGPESNEINRLSIHPSFQVHRSVEDLKSHLRDQSVLAKTIQVTHEQILLYADEMTAGSPLARKYTQRLLVLFFNPLMKELQTSVDAYSQLAVSTTIYHFFNEVCKGVDQAAFQMFDAFDEMFDDIGVDPLRLRGDIAYIFEGFSLKYIKALCELGLIQENLVSVKNVFQKKIKYVTDKFSEFDKCMVKVTDDIIENFPGNVISAADEILNGVDTVLRDIHSELSKIGESLEDGVWELEAAVQNSVAESWESVNKTTRCFEAKLAHIAKNVQGAVEEIAEDIGELNEDVQEHIETAFESSADVAEKEASIIGNQLERVAHQVEEVVSEPMQNLAESVSSGLQKITAPLQGFSGKLGGLFGNDGNCDKKSEGWYYASGETPSSEPAKPKRRKKKTSGLQSDPPTLTVISEKTSEPVEKKDLAISSNDPTLTVISGGVAQNVVLRKKKVVVPITITSVPETVTPVPAPSVVNAEELDPVHAWKKKRKKTKGKGTLAVRLWN